MCFTSLLILTPHERATCCFSEQVGKPLGHINFANRVLIDWEVIKGTSIKGSREDNNQNLPQAQAQGDTKPAYSHHLKAKLQQRLMDMHGLATVGVITREREREGEGERERKMGKGPGVLPRPSAGPGRGGADAPQCCPCPGWWRGP